MAEYILVDTSYWLAILDPRDQHHAAAVEREEWLETATLVLPWPILYETIRTRLVRNRERMLRFDRLLKRPQIAFIEDAPFREVAYELAVQSARDGQRAFSMVDSLCRLLIEDVNTRIDGMLTSNPEDFWDVCERAGVVLL